MSLHLRDFVPTISLVLATACGGSKAPLSEPPVPVQRVLAPNPQPASPEGKREWPEDLFAPGDVFSLEWATDPQVSPDGKHVVYVRNRYDVMNDGTRRDLWLLSVDGQVHRPITNGERSFSTPRWSPDGQKLLYLGQSEGKSQFFVRWMEAGTSARVSHLTESPGSVEWSPDGKQIVFTMHVPASTPPMVTMPSKPEGAKWSDPPRVVDDVMYRRDGEGLLREGYTHVFVIPAEGGTPRQVTQGDFDHRSPAWSADGKSVYFSSNRREDWEHELLDTEIYRVDLQSLGVEQVTDRRGPDGDPVASPDGKYLAYIGFDDAQQGYQVENLYLLDLRTKKSRVLSKLDRSIASPRWDAASKNIYVLFDDHGNSKIGRIALDGRSSVVVGDVGASLGRPYPGQRSFSLSRDGLVAYPRTRPMQPADVAVADSGKSKRLTDLNADAFAGKRLVDATPISVKSSVDSRAIDAWVMNPPTMKEGERYPMLLEIHGGPFANYGDRFSAEMQLFAAAGFVVVYANPRGSTSYGEEFGNLIHHAYPGKDYDDLMSVVDAVVARGYVDPDRLYVTGGSGGGVLTSWIVGKTDRFAGAVVVKPVINWYSFVLTSDYTNYFYRYWFPGFPWDNPQHYLDRSPLSLVGNVKTPTMVMSGEADYRTPIAEAEQFYQALKLRKVDTVLVRIPGASHHIAARPSRLIAKVLHVIAWCDKHGARGQASEKPSTN